MRSSVQKPQSLAAGQMAAAREGLEAFKRGYISSLMKLVDLVEQQSTGVKLAMGVAFAMHALIPLLYINHAIGRVAVLFFVLKVSAIQAVLYKTNSRVWMASVTLLNIPMLLFLWPITVDAVSVLSYTALLMDRTIFPTLFVNWCLWFVVFNTIATTLGGIVLCNNIPVINKAVGHIIPSLPLIGVTKRDHKSIKEAADGTSATSFFFAASPKSVSTPARSTIPEAPALPWVAPKVDSGAIHGGQGDPLLNSELKYHAPDTPASVLDDAIPFKVASAERDSSPCHGDPLMDASKRYHEHEDTLETEPDPLLKKLRHEKIRRDLRKYFIDKDRRDSLKQGSVSSSSTASAIGHMKSEQDSADSHKSDDLEPAKSSTVRKRERKRENKSVDKVDPTEKVLPQPQPACPLSDGWPAVPAS